MKIVKIVAGFILMGLTLASIMGDYEDLRTLSALEKQLELRSEETFKEITQVNPTIAANFLDIKLQSNKASRSISKKHRNIWTLSVYSLFLLGFIGCQFISLFRKKQLS